jgi:hypothetical protein
VRVHPLVTALLWSLAVWVALVVGSIEAHHFHLLP